MSLVTLTTVLAFVPRTLEWSPTVGIIMILCNVFAIALGKLTMATPEEGPALPMPEMFGGMGLPALLGTTSLGHAIGMGTIIGLATLGII